MTDHGLKRTLNRGLFWTAINSGNRLQRVEGLSLKIHFGLADPDAKRAHLCSRDHSM